MGNSASNSCAFSATTNGANAAKAASAACTATSKVPITFNAAAPSASLQPGTWPWLVRFRDPREIWHDEPTFLLCELELYALAVLSFVHARRHGGRYLWLWWTTILHGFTVELISYWYEDIDNFWHAQSSLMWFGMREPLHIICLYPGYIYPAAVAVSRLNMLEWCRPFAVGLLEALIDLPYDIMGIKLLWWSWHDTDSNIYDRSYSVPWCSYFFHASFGAAFTFLRQRCERHFTSLSGLHSDADVEAMPWRKKQLASAWWREVAVAVCVGATSFPFGVLSQFVPLYHIPHDIFGVTSEICVMTLLLGYGAITLWGILRAHPRKLVEEGSMEQMRRRKRTGPGSWHVDEVFLAVLLHFTFYCCLVLFADPSAVRATGLHQELAPPGCHSEMALNESVGLLGLPDTPLDITRHKYVDHASGTVTKVTLRYGFYELLLLLPAPLRTFLGLPPAYTVTIERNETLCASNFSEPTMDFWCEGVAQQRCRHETPPAQMDDCSLPEAGRDWYTLCGTGYEVARHAPDGSGRVVGSRDVWPEYVMLIVGSSFIALNIFATALAYPRSLLDIVRDGRLPRYYKVRGGPPAQKRVARIIDRRIDDRPGGSGEEEYLVLADSDSDSDTDADANTSAAAAAANACADKPGAGTRVRRKGEWRKRGAIVSDGSGAVYAERGGLYGLHGVHGETSTRERLRDFDSHRHALLRIGMWKRKQREQERQRH